MKSTFYEPLDGARLCLVLKKIEEFHVQAEHCSYVVLVVSLIHYSACCPIWGPSALELSLIPMCLSRVPRLLLFLRHVSRVVLDRARRLMRNGALLVT